MQLMFLSFQVHYYFIIQFINLVNYLFNLYNMIEAKLTKSDKPDKKYKVVVESKDKKRTLHFGQKGASDYTRHKDDERKKRYLDRHRANEDWRNPYTAGWWSRWLLWEKKTLKEAKKNIEKTKNIDFK